MSINYFVEGKITNRVKGDYLAFSKESISHNSALSIEQSGKESGVSYHHAKVIQPNDNPVNLLEVNLNLFFDGTQNNKTNTDLGKDYKESNHEDDSYTNEYSNVARGYDAVDPTVENQVRVYIEGIGTEDTKSEMHLFGNVPNQGILFGTGPRGVIAKVTKGCVQAGRQLAKYSQKDIHLKVNVFGFSRGATAARHFLHIATNPARVLKKSEEIGMAVPPYEAEGERIEVRQNDELVLKHGYLGACLIKNKVIPKRITFNFAGLYDTVASYGMDHREKSIMGKTVISGDTRQLGLDAIKKAYFTLQIAAENEYRDNFDLTDVDSAGVRGLQFILPGVHSDIGGCYVNGNEEKVDLYTEKENEGRKCEEFRNILIEEGWYTPEEIVVQKITDPHKYGVNTKYILVGTRRPFNTYDRISLHTMFYYSKKFGVKYDKTIINGNHKITDPFLIEIHEQLIDYMNTCNTLRNTYVRNYNQSHSSGDYLTRIKALHYEDFMDLDQLKRLRNKYLHWSASATKIGYGPRVGKVASGKERTRNIQYG
ncbi:phospholipase effector Tle1 domain-containing protein [Chryseobacterium vrystaatense]|uniref:Uncharacterized alpha/beta hydrolase domain n=1 Tax=Chryseobacterium vrystaatense TaxID=307480 RepID=A0A1M5N3P9_9FLAO|nr:DUF2235 domain-containing protein [Chryseobacterium vrystaatense]SHG84161.1 Uncharacterized alpha/beta hydrolase domain [Chryseobacterium vrystaatense]